MGVLIALVITLAIIAFIADALVEGFANGKNINKWAIIGYKVIVCIILFGVLILLGKCGCTSGYEYTPSGETTLEHYEPR
ncbi:MAG: hypothetical protein IKC85_04810 [Bacteroidaceae bacterium]|nr:hypothetical protein [Bacteroidaceae bacterium]